MAFAELLACVSALPAARAAYKELRQALAQRRGAKRISLVCWYGPHHYATRVARWMAAARHVCMPARAWRILRSRHLPDTRRAVLFVFNSGTHALDTRDFFESIPLVLRLVGGEQLQTASVRFASEQVGQVRLGDRSGLIACHEPDRLERRLQFEYLAPRHGIAIDVIYRSSESAWFELRGPVRGMQNAIPHQAVFDLDIDNPRRCERRRVFNQFKLALGALLMGGILAALYRNGFLNPGKSPVAWGDRGWIMMGLMLIGEWTALTSWFHLRQHREVPVALRYWMSRRKVKDSGVTWEPSLASPADSSRTRPPTAP